MTRLITPDVARAVNCFQAGGPDRATTIPDARTVAIQDEIEYLGGIRPECHPCVDAAEFGDIMCRGCFGRRP